jgi:hypothetical protein
MERKGCEIFGLAFVLPALAYWGLCALFHPGVDVRQMLAGALAAAGFYVLVWRNG